MQEDTKPEPTPEPSAGAPVRKGADSPHAGYLVCRLRPGQKMMIGLVELVLAECRSGHAEIALRAPRDIRIRRAGA